MKKAAHIISVILSVCLIVISICFFAFSGPIAEGNNVLAYISGACSLIFVLIFLLYGAIVPDRTVYLSSRYKGVGAALSAANALLNDTVVSSSVWDLFEGKVPIRRAWTSMGYFIVLVILGPVVAINFIGGNTLLCCTSIAWYVAMGLSLISTAIWENEYYKEETGRSGWPRIAKQYGIAIGIVLVISVVVVGYDRITGKSYANIDKIESDVAQLHDKMDKLEDMPIFEETEYASLEDALLVALRDFKDQKAYYCVKELGKNQVSILVWTDDSEKVVVNLFRIRLQSKM